MVRHAHVEEGHGVFRHFLRRRAAQGCARQRLPARAPRGETDQRSRAAVCRRGDRFEVGAGGVASRRTVIDAVRASIALPGLFMPWTDNGRILVDGALVNPVPVSLCRAMGATFVIAVDLSSTLVGPAVRKVTAEKKAAAVPGMAEIVMNSLHIMSTRITRSRLAGEPADVVLMPRLGQFGLLDYHRAPEAIAEGRDATAVLTPQIHRLLGHETQSNG